jgi:hypothetical protein
VAGIVVTQVSYRQYRQLSVDIGASYVVKIAGQAYGASEQLTNQWFLTVDVLDLTRFFNRSSSTGFLEKRSTPLTPDIKLKLPKTADEVRKLEPDPETEKLIRKWNDAKDKTDIEPLSPP